MSGQRGRHFPVYERRRARDTHPSGFSQGSDETGNTCCDIGTKGLRRLQAMKSQANPATKAVRASIESDAHHGAVVPPLHLSSTFTFAGFGEKRQYGLIAVLLGHPPRDRKSSPRIPCRSFSQRYSLKTRLYLGWREYKCSEPIGSHKNAKIGEE